ncbi:MAG: hypothetical protein Q9217_004072 [Psora testacea]
MAPSVCCGFRRAPSPDGIPIRLVDNAGRTFTMSANGCMPPSSSVEESKTDRENLTLTDPQEPLSSAKPDHHLEPAHGVSVRHKDSITRVQAVARGIKKRISRDSGASAETSARALRSTMSTEDIEKRKGWKCPLRSLSGSEVFDDRSEVYDEDAVPIKTPRGTWLRQKGAIRMSPSRSTSVMARSSSSVPSGTKESNLLAPYQPENAKARALSRMLTERGGRLADVSTEDGNRRTGDSAVDRPELSKKRSSKKYVFRDDTPSPAKSRSSSPLGRSDTVVHIASNAASVEVGALTFLNSVGPPAAPGLHPTRLASIGDSIGGKDWHLSHSDTRKVSLVSEFGVKEKPPEDQQPGSPNSLLALDKAPWLRGASGSLASSPSAMPGSWIHTHCDPENEEASFGGVDGKESPVHAETHSDVSNPASVHLYDMRISQRLASHGIVPAASSPHLEGESSNDKSRGFRTENLSLPSRHRASSSDFGSSKAPSTCGVPRRTATSSAYTTISGHHSYTSSQIAFPQAPSDQFQITAIHGPASPQQSTVLDSLAQKQPDASTEAASTDVAITRLHSIDVNETELLSLPIRPLTRSKSLTTPEIEAAEGELFSRRAETVAQSRYFSQAELDELAREIALRTLPRGRSVSCYDGSSEGSSWGRRASKDSRPPKKPSIVAGDEPTGTSVWEKALREHVEEDVRLSKLGLGSVATNRSKSYCGKKPTSRSQESYLRHVYISSEGQDEDLQAHLHVYKLPPPSDRLHRPAAQDNRRIESSITSSSWSRFPSHSRAERSMSPATEKDKVFARDFAPMAGTKSVGNLKKQRRNSMGKAHSTHFEKLRHSLKDIYRAKSIEFSSRFAFESRNHRSSVSEGGMAEYPELEMLPSLSPPYVSEGEGEGEGFPSKGSYVEGRRQDIHWPGEYVARGRNTQGAVSPSGSARKWSRLYEDCVVRDASGLPHDSGVMRHPYADAMSEHFAPMDMEPVRVFDHSCHDVRASTMDFKKRLEEDEQRGRKRVLCPAARSEA